MRNVALKAHGERVRSTPFVATFAFLALVAISQRYGGPYALKYRD